jgi:hypothetical protein
MELRTAPEQRFRIFFNNSIHGAEELLLSRGSGSASISESMELRSCS